MPGPLATAGVQAGANILSTGVNAFFQGTANRKQRKWNEKMYAQQRADALADWNMQNAYDSPAAQMQRLKDAKLNPNLVYGNGTTGITSSGNIRGVEAKAWSPNAPNIDMSWLAPLVMQQYDIELKQAQTDNVRAATEVAHEDAALRWYQQAETNMRTARTRQEIERAQFDLEQARNLAPIAIDQAKENLRKTRTDIGFTMNADQRAAAQSAQTIKEGVAHVLLLQEQAAKTREEIENIRQARKLMQEETYQKEMENAMREIGANPNGGLMEKAVMIMIDKLMKGRQRPSSTLQR